MEPFDRSYTTYYQLSYLTLNIIVTLKCGLEASQGHCKWYHLKAWVRFPICLLQQLRPYLKPFWRYSVSKNGMGIGIVGFNVPLDTLQVISEMIFVKEWPDLEIGVCGPSRSLKMARFDRPCMTFYQSAIVTIALSCIICKLFDVE